MTCHPATLESLTCPQNGQCDSGTRVAHASSRPGMCLSLNAQGIHTAPGVPLCWQGGLVLRRRAVSNM